MFLHSPVAHTGRAPRWQRGALSTPSALKRPDIAPQWYLLGIVEKAKGCRYGADAAMYGLALRHGAGVSCEDAAVKELTDLLKLVFSRMKTQELPGPHYKPEYSVLTCNGMQLLLKGCHCDWHHAGIIYCVHMLGVNADATQQLC